MVSKLFLLFGIIAIGYGAIIKEPVAILSQNSDVRPDGSFEWNYEGADGSKHQQKGTVRHVDKETFIVIEGSISWTDPEGEHHKITYIADENGYQAKGGDLPVAPEIPGAIVRALEWISAHPESETKH